MTSLPWCASLTRTPRNHQKVRVMPEIPTTPASQPTPSLLLAYLAAAHRRNAEAEVSGPELQHELGLDAVAVRETVADLARQGLVEWDPLLSNVWLRITDKGLAAAERYLGSGLVPTQ